MAPDFLFSVTFCVALLASSALRLWLDARHVRHVTLHRQAVPVAFASRISLDAHQKAADYTVAKTRLHSLGVVLGAAILIGWTLLGGLQSLDEAMRRSMGQSFGPMAYQLGLLAAYTLLGSLIELPLSLYSTFGLEARFGFNRTTFKLWFIDGLKGMVLGAALGLPLMALILALMAQAGSAWWLWAWGTFLAFQLVMLVVYPTVIAPWFNRFLPLEDVALRARAERLMARCGFQAKGFFVMDGSRRSAHGNAYFTGFGAAKRVVFYDTLLARLTHGEVEAVLAHELGHFHHKHIVKRVAMMAVVSLAGFALLGWLAAQPWFFAGLGVEPNVAPPRDALALVLFSMALPVFLFFVTPWMSWLSRRDEYQADAYARQQSSGPELASALLKLYEDNAGTLTPDPWYVKVYASHPPAALRLAALSA